MSAPELSTAEAATVTRFEAGQAAPESWTGSQVAVDLRMAADVLERDGWGQGSFHLLVEGRTCHCAEGAVSLATGFHKAIHAVRDGSGRSWDGLVDWFESGSRIASERAAIATDYLHQYVGESVPSWNDSPLRTADEVIAAMRSAADEADQA